MKTFFLPYMSATFPKGRRNMAALRIYAVAIQLSISAFMENSLPMDGSATLTVDKARGVRKEDRVVAINTGHLPSVLLSILFC